MNAEALGVLGNRQATKRNLNGLERPRDLRRVVDIICVRDCSIKLNVPDYWTLHGISCVIKPGPTRVGGSTEHLVSSLVACASDLFDCATWLKFKQRSSGTLSCLWLIGRSLYMRLFSTYSRVQEGPWTLVCATSKYSSPCEPKSVSAVFWALVLNSCMLLETAQSDDWIVSSTVCGSMDPDEPAAIHARRVCQGCSNDRQALGGASPASLNCTAGPIGEYSRWRVPTLHLCTTRWQDYKADSCSASERASVHADRRPTTPRRCSPCPRPGLSG